MSRFAALDGQVRRARIRRLVWSARRACSAWAAARVGGALLVEQALLGAV